jgi:two-component system, NtrC family, response regulator AtoC
MKGRGGSGAEATEQRASFMNPEKTEAGAGLSAGSEQHEIVGGLRMRRLFRHARRMASTTAPVIVFGESGTGKEHVAAFVHRESQRSAGPFVTVNCGGLQPSLLLDVLFGHDRGAFTGADAQRSGLFENAHGGTLFLDELGELCPEGQSALLRVLETGEITRVGATRARRIDVRIVAATHRNLDEMVEKGTFRHDLYYRLRVLSLTVPALRERRADIRPLAQHFAQIAAEKYACTLRTIAEEAMAQLQGYDWPGNVRQLKNVVTQAAVMCRGTEIRSSDLPAELGTAGRPSEPKTLPPLEAALSAWPSEGSYRERLRNFEMNLIVSALKEHGGNQSRAAKSLAMPLRTLVHKISAFGLQKRYVEGEA